MPKQAPKAQLSFSSVLLLGINGIIGSGIFLLPSTLFKQAGWQSLTIIGLAGLATTLIAMSYAVMASKIDEDGGAWVYANRAFGPLAGFMTGWFSWFLGVITIATELAAFLTTLGGFLPSMKQRGLYLGVAFFVLAVLTVLNCFGPGAMKLIDNLSSAVKIGLVVLFIGGAAWFVFSHGSQPVAAVSDAKPLKAFTTAFYMYTGFSFLPVAAREMKNTEKTLPRALLLVMAVVIGLYLLTQALTIAILGGKLSGEALPVAAAFNVVLGPVGRALILGGMLASTLGVAVAVSFDTPLALASLATEKHLLPAVFGRKNRFSAPVVAVLATMALATGLILSGSYLFLVNLIVFSSFAQYIATILAQIKLRRAQDLPAGFHEPLGLTFPMVSLLLIVALMTQFTARTYLIGVGFALLGGVIYWLDRRKRK